MDKPTPFLSVCLITYNHASFVREALESIFMQKIDSSWELIIADDYSTDDTRNILQEYKEKYPSIVKLLLQEKNVGPAKNFEDLMSSPKSKYIAYLEGDDYWTDACKLQKQVDFLEQNKTYNLCGAKWKLKNKEEYTVDKVSANFSKEKILQPKDFLNISVSPIHTSTVLFRNIFETINFPWIQFRDFPIGDIPLFFIFSLHGKVMRFNDFVSVYRRGNPSSVTSSRKLNSIYPSLIQMLNFLDELSKSKYQGIIKNEIKFITQLNRIEEIKQNRFMYLLFLCQFKKRLRYSLRDVLYLVRHHND
jgi:glycosyltransferase involved in cell wall biosynthesis